MKFNRSDYYILLLYFGAAVFLFHNTLWTPFFSDDPAYIKGALADESPLRIWEFFTEPYWKTVPQHAIYRPVTSWSISATKSFCDAFLSEGHVFLYRLGNVLLHAVAAFMVRALCLKLSFREKAASLAGLVFCIYPFHTEAVNFVVNRSESLALIFGALYLIRHFDQKIVSANVFLLLAVFSKESAITFPAFAFAVDLSRNGWSLKSTLAKGMSQFAINAVVLAGWLILRTHVVEGFETGAWKIANPLVGVDAVTRIQSALAMQFEYLRYLILPTKIVSDFHIEELEIARSFFDLRIVAFLLAGAGVLFFVLKQKKEERDVYLLLLLGYFIFLSPNSNFVATVGPMLSERSAYIPSVFYCAALGYVIVLKALTRDSVVAICLGFSVWTLVRNQPWSSPLTYYEQSVKSSPRSYHAHVQLAIVRSEAGMFEAAEEEFAKAIEIAPHDYIAPQRRARNSEHLAALKQDPLTVAKRLWEVNSTDFEIWIQYGSLLFAADKAQGSRILHETMGLFPNEIEKSKGTNLGAVTDERTRELIAISKKYNPLRPQETAEEYKAFLEKYPEGFSQQAISIIQKRIEPSAP